MTHYWTLGKDLKVKDAEYGFELELEDGDLAIAGEIIELADNVPFTGWTDTAIEPILQQLKFLCLGAREFSYINDDGIIETLKGDFIGATDFGSILRHFIGNKADNSVYATIITDLITLIQNLFYIEEIRSFGVDDSTDGEININIEVRIINDRKTYSMRF